MAEVALSRLHKDLDRWVRAAEAGATVLVTDGGRVVARLVPPGPDLDEIARDEAVLAQLAAEGRLTPATVPGYAPRRARDRDLVPFEDLMRGLDEDRADRC
jgi:antitoxin (DNA-binding transcriptional repressor) of toxin-antitoxin stability system